MTAIASHERLVIRVFLSILIFDILPDFYDGGSMGTFATRNGEPRQARKGAAATVNSGAEVLLIELPP